MRKIIAAVFTLATTAAALAPIPAHAATAFLVNCQTATSVTGRFMYVGTYNYGGQQFTRSFGSYCPQSVEVY
jgi:hypothetical protein